MNLLEILKRIRDEGPDDPRYGVCDSVVMYASSNAAVLVGQFRSLCKQWPRYSGSATFPVPAPGDGCPADYYFCGTRAENNWNPDHPYGAARLELLNWCIEQLEAQQ